MGITAHTLTADTVTARLSTVLRVWVLVLGALVLSVVAAFPAGAQSTPPAQGSDGFDDVPEGHYASEAIGWAGTQRIALAVPDGGFGPDDGMSRAGAITFLYRALGPDWPPGDDTTVTVKGSDIFTDVAAGTETDDAIGWAYTRGITTGTTATTFGPDKNLSRVHFAAFFYRALGADWTIISPTPVAGLGSDTFTDIPKGHYADQAIGWAVAQGITTGTTTTTFSPNRPLTRAHTVTFLYRALGPDWKAKAPAPPETTPTPEPGSPETDPEPVDEIDEETVSEPEETEDISKGDYHSCVIQGYAWCLLSDGSWRVKKESYIYVYEGLVQVCGAFEVHDYHTDDCVPFQGTPEQLEIFPHNCSPWLSFDADLTENLERVFEPNMNKYGSCGHQIASWYYKPVSTWVRDARGEKPNKCHL